MNGLKGILPFADMVADEIVADKIVCEETDLLEGIIPRMYKVMHKISEVSCDYIKHGRSSPYSFARADNRSRNGGQAGLSGDDHGNRR